MLPVTCPLPLCLPLIYNYADVTYEIFHVLIIPVPDMQQYLLYSKVFKGLSMFLKVSINLTCLVLPLTNIPVKKMLSFVLF